MTAMLVIFFVEFGSSRYLAKVDEKVMQMQLCDPTNQNSLVQPVKSLLNRRKVVVNGRLVNIDPEIAGQAADRVAETLVRETPPPDEESPLLVSEEGRKPHHDSHCGHHHYDPPPVDGHGTLNDVTRKSQLLGVAILEGGLCFHSIFVGLTLAVATGGGFISLLIAIMFHRISPSSLTNQRNIRGTWSRCTNRHIIVPTEIYSTVSHGNDICYCHSCWNGDWIVDSDIVFS
jgi:hypothetical protein